MTETARQPVDLAAVFDLATLGDLQWSPDGRTIACVVSRPDLDANKERSTLWLLDVAGERPPRRLTSGQAADRMPRWSPAGDTIAFVSNRGGRDQLWAIHPDGGEAWLLSGADEGCGPIATDDFFAALEWSPDGSRLAFVAQEPAPPSDPDASDARVVGRDDGEGYGEIRRLQVFTVPATGGAPRQVTSGDYHHGDPRWSPDGRQIVFVSNRSGDEEAVRYSINKDYDLWLLDVESGEARQLTTNPGPDIGPRWSPDGRLLAYTRVSRRGSHRDVFQLAVTSADGREVLLLTDVEGANVDRLTGASWSPDGRFLCCTTASRAANEVLLVSLSGEPSRTLVGGDRVAEWAVLAPSGREVACVLHGPECPPEVCVVPVEGGEPRRLTSFNSSWQARAIARTEVRRWRSVDGLEVEGLVTRPPAGDPGARPPLLVMPHGGPHSRSALGFNAEWQYWAARGYVVFAPNYRGSLGYGQAFVDADRGDFGGGDFADLMSGVDALIADGLVDPDRLAIVGGSYGGFLTAWAIGHTERFRAAVALAPVVNLHSLYGQTDIKSWVEWEFGLPWEARDSLTAHSPITYVASARTPTLIVHGDEDRRVPPPQSQELYSALRKLGVETQFVRYPREGHGIKEPRHRRDLLTRVGEWLDRHLGL